MGNTRLRCARKLVACAQSTLVFAELLLLCASAQAAEFYVDPAAGAASGDGSQAKPWQTLEAVVQAGHIGKEVLAGDTIWLRTGYHGVLAAKGGDYATPITLAAAMGQTPQLSRASFSQTHGWVLSGVSISPSHAPSPQVGNIVQVDKSSSNIVVRDCQLFSVADASGWGANEWINSASSGFQISGDHVTASHNSVKNVRFGISVDGPNALIEYNQVVNFSADGLRGLGDFGVFQFNVVKNVYVDQNAGDDNHDDGFQSWSTGSNGPGSGVVQGVVLRGNYFLNREDPNQKLPNSMQGIGCFDGMFDDWVVENNVVATDHWHGISFYGMRNSRIVNNTVIDINSASPGPPWIMVTPHKDGTASANVIVRNNLATDYDISGNSIVQDHNTTLQQKDLGVYFVSPDKFDLHLLPNAAAIDQGGADQAPALDADRIPRPQGKAIDLGAYEWHEASVTPVTPVDGGAGMNGGGAAGRGGTGVGGSAGSAGGVAGGSSQGRGAGGKSGGAAGMSANAGAGAGNTGDAGTARAGGEQSQGCGCAVPGVRGSAHGWMLLALIPWLRRARRRWPGAARGRFTA